MTARAAKPAKRPSGTRWQGVDRRLDGAATQTAAASEAGSDMEDIEGGVAVGPTAPTAGVGRAYGLALAGSHG